jgi:hypothetical protein
MTKVTASVLPETALLRRHATGANYTDCFTLDVSQPVSLARFVGAFYTTWLFRAERVILTLAARPSTDRQAAAVAAGQADTFAAWQVEARAPDQLLLCDMTGRTRSWFMVLPRPDGQTGTRLCFGSAIVAVPGRNDGAQTIGPLFRALTSAHVLYSRALLATAAARLARQPNGSSVDMATP